jgi:hypothetical protein
MSPITAPNARRKYDGYFTGNYYSNAVVGRWTATWRAQRHQTDPADDACQLYGCFSLDFHDKVHVSVRSHPYLNVRNRGGMEQMRKSGAIRRLSTFLAMALSLFVLLDISPARAQNPAIKTCPKFIDAVDGFEIDGMNFGTAGQIHIRFPHSAVQLPNGVFTHELIISAQASDWHQTVIHTNSIAITYPMGAVDDQGVEITVSGVHGKPVSKPCPAQFVGQPKILSGSGSITPNQLFSLYGWNFGHAGTLNVHFPKASAVPFSPNNPNDLQDLNVPIPTPLNNSWRRFGIMLQLPPVSGEIGQQVEITFKRSDGKGSNTWKPMFVPTIAVATVPQQDVSLVTCSNAGVDNTCTNGAGTIERSYFCAFPLIDAGGVVGSFWGGHTGCAGIGSTNGTDTYSINVKNGWTLDQVDFTPATPDDPCCVNNGSVYPSGIAPIGTSTPYPNPYNFDVPWHVGAEGGWVNYDGNFIVDGPKGVPY